MSKQSVVAAVLVLGVIGLFIFNRFFKQDFLTDKDWGVVVSLRDVRDMCWNGLNIENKSSFTTRRRSGKARVISLECDHLPDVYLLSKVIVGESTNDSSALLQYVHDTLESGMTLERESEAQDDLGTTFFYRLQRGNKVLGRAAVHQQQSRGFVLVIRPSDDVIVAGMKRLVREKARRLASYSD